MAIIRAKDIPGTQITGPYERVIKVLLAPDRNDVAQLTLSQVVIPSFSCTDSHIHDRPELIYIISGNGEVTLGEMVYSVEPDTAVWVPPQVKHCTKNTSHGELKFVTIFVPAYTAETLIQGIKERSM